MEKLNIEVVNNETLFYNNLLLLGYEKELSEKECQTAITATSFQKSNTKAFFYVIYFLLSKLTKGESEEQFITCYPPNNTQHHIEFKVICLKIFSELEKEGKVPMNFVVGKSILDTYHGERLVLFLRFLSEFALRFVMSVKFPNETNEILSIGRMNKDFKGIPLTKTKLPYDINLLYEFLSTNNESYIHNSISREELKMASDALAVHLKIKRERLAKTCSKIEKRNEAYKEKALEINKKYQEERRKNNDLEQKLAKIKEKVRKEVFEKNRSLDRTRMTDKSREIFKHLGKVSDGLIQQDLMSRLEEYLGERDSSHIVTTVDKDMLLKNPAKLEGQSVSISSVYGQFNDRLATMVCDISNREKYIHAKHEFEELVRAKAERIAKLKELKERMCKIIEG